MKKIIKKINIIGSLIFYSNSTMASLQDFKGIQPDSIDETKIGSNSISHVCKKLLHFEYKNELLEKEIDEANLLSDIIANIADSPIDYCEFNIASHQIDANENTYLK